MKKIMVVIAVMAIILNGCSANNNSNNNDVDVTRGEEYGNYSEMDEASTDFGYTMSAKLSPVVTATSSDSMIVFNESSDDGYAEDVEVDFLTDQRKIIKSGYMTMETLKYDDAIIKLQEKVNEIGGYIEVSNIGGASIYEENQMRHAYFTLRIPQTSFQFFMEEINTIGHVISQQSNGQDITSTYYDTDARVNTLEIQEERLLEILKKAERIEDILILEQELSSVRYEIERMTQSLRRMDQLVSYSTLEVTIREVHEITEEEVIPVGLSEKIKDGFNSSIEDLKEGFENLLISTSSASPYLIFIIPGLFIVFIIYKKIKRGYMSNKIENDSDDESEKKE